MVAGILADAATAIVLKPKSASMQKVTPSVIKGAARLTKTLRKSSTTHPLVKMVPIITRLTNETQTKIWLVAGLILSIKIAVLQCQIFM